MGWRSLAHYKQRSHAVREVAHQKRQGSNAKVGKQTPKTRLFPVLLWIDLKGKHKGLRPRH